MRSLLVDQITKPVLWAQSLQFVLALRCVRCNGSVIEFVLSGRTALDAGVRSFVECGPTAALTPLAQAQLTRFASAQPQPTAKQQHSQPQAKPTAPSALFVA